MRQSIALTLLFLYLFTSTEFSELLKFPLLVEHYKEHKQEHPEITFASFVCQHYTQGEVEDADKDQDMKLPYKTIDFTHTTSFTVLPTITSFEFNEIIAFELLKAPLNCYNVIFSSDNFSSIWQPPKIV